MLTFKTDVVDLFYLKLYIFGLDIQVAKIKVLKKFKFKASVQFHFSNFSNVKRKQFYEIIKPRVIVRWETDNLGGKKTEITRNLQQEKKDSNFLVKEIIIKQASAKTK